MCRLLLELLEDALACGAVLERELGDHLTEVVRPGVTQLVRGYTQPRQETAESDGGGAERSGGETGWSGGQVGAARHPAVDLAVDP